MNSIIISIISQSNSRSFNGFGDGWVNLCHIGSELRKRGIEFLGSLYDYLQSNPEFETHKDCSGKIPVAYARCLKVVNYSPTSNKTTNRNEDNLRLTDWAYLGEINSFLDSLVSVASKDEVWSYWRKRSMPTHSERFNPPNFESKNG